MTLYAILEHIDLKHNLRETANQGIHAKHNNVAYKSFADKDGFERGLFACMKELWAQPDDQSKVLIISAHGVPRTGTELEASNGKLINFFELKNYFEVLPKNLVVYVSACFGAYPSVMHLQEKSVNPQFIVGPLVDIKFTHANKFQTKLIDCLSDKAPSLRLIYKLIRHFNKPGRYPTDYAGRVLFGMYDNNKNFFPRSFIGGQYAAPVEPWMKFTLVSNVLGQSELIDIQDDSGNRYHISKYELKKHNIVFEGIVGASFKAKYQVDNSDINNLARILLVKVRK